MSVELTAEHFIQSLVALQSDEEKRKIQRYFKSGEGEYGEGDEFMGVKMGQVFATAKAHIDMPIGELEKLLESPIHEVRAGACSIMDKSARRAKLSDEQRAALYGLYLRRHDRINNWDLVDLAAGFVIGRYLADRPRDVLDRLACSENTWERRTAIAATSYFLRQGQPSETFRVAELLVNDPEDIINKCVGGWLRAAGDIDRSALVAFLERHAATMPRVTLRFALEHFEPTGRQQWMSLRKA